VTGEGRSSSCLLLSVFSDNSDSILHLIWMRCNEYGDDRGLRHPPCSIHEMLEFEFDNEERNARLECINTTSLVSNIEPSSTAQSYPLQLTQTNFKHQRTSNRNNAFPNPPPRTPNPPHPCPRRSILPQAPRHRRLVNPRLHPRLPGREYLHLRLHPRHLWLRSTALHHH
jgi:hypothetical protein